MALDRRLELVPALQPLGLRGERRAGAAAKLGTARAEEDAITRLEPKLGLDRRVAAQLYVPEGAARRLQLGHARLVRPTGCRDRAGGGGRRDGQRRTPIVGVGRRVVRISAVEFAELTA